eukprot:3141721-Lingulodinium_polyedra.AAC.1
MRTASRALRLARVGGGTCLSHLWGLAWSVSSSAFAPHSTAPSGRDVSTRIRGTALRGPSVANEGRVTRLPRKVRCVFEVFLAS